MTIPFVKVQSIGNDFVLVEARDVPEDNLRGLAMAMCERQFGIGSDGLLVYDDRPDIIMLRMFNPDGSEDFCGNGLRCAAAFAHRRGRGPEFVINHRGVEVPVTIQADGRVKFLLPAASYDPVRVPVSTCTPWIEEEAQGYIGSALTTGSAHFVVLLDAELDEETFLQVSPKIENDPEFPERISVMWAVPDGDGARIRIWERGVGETLGCGTGATATAVELARKTGRRGLIPVTSRGGTLEIEVKGIDQPLAVLGQANIVFQGEWPRPQA
jgi:diaminopimelate epimerase